MTRLKLGTIEMLGKVAGFAKMVAGRIAKGSLPQAAFDTVNAALATISTLGALPGRTGSRPGTEARDAARDILRADLETIHQTMLAVAIDHPGVEANFRLPRSRRNDQANIRAAQEFIKYAAPLKDAFAAHLMPSNFLDKLASEIAALQQAINAQAAAKSDRQAASDTLTQAIDDARIALQRLDAMIPNMFGNDAEVMAAWNIVRQINKPRRRKKAAANGHSETPSASLPHPPEVTGHPPASPPA